MTTITASGHCLCGQVKLTVNSVPAVAGACHCRTCRQWSGSPMMTIDCGQQVEITGGEYIRRYDSSDWDDRGFCQTCGTHLFYQLKATQHYFVPVGLLNTRATLDFDHQIFIEQKPGVL